MSKELKFITCCPSDSYFTWQVHLWLESLKELNKSDKAVVLIFNPLNRSENNKWQQIINLYPEVEFHFYKDDGTVAPVLGTYIPILRPYLMMKYSEEYPEIKDKALFYCDSDILFTKNFNVDKLIDDDIIYLSDTNSYINATYFGSKIKDVLPAKVEDYKKIDVLDTAAKIIGINRGICEKNNMHSGGTQYLLKNVDADFWRKMFQDTIPLIKYMRSINKEYFESENKGFQSWVSDMWSLLWNLWYRGYETKVVPEMLFRWCHDGISLLDTCGIYHNAGATNEGTDDFPIFYKGKYHQGNNPMVDPHLDKILNNEKSMKHCTGYYVKKMDELRLKYNLQY
jgi:hypothetical protein